MYMNVVRTTCNKQGVEVPAFPQNHSDWSAKSPDGIIHVIDHMITKRVVRTEHPLLVLEEAASVATRKYRIEHLKGEKNKKNYCHTE
jgi:hypothetical protein